MSSPRILVADDEPALLRLLEFVLGRRGYVIQGVSNGDAAIDVLKTECPDLAILDVMMPGRDGFEVLTFIRETDHLAGLPVVLLTARAQLDDIQQGLSLGADAYLAKPFDPEELLSVVESLVS
ncbi:MAG: Phosphate regulon transcriptional regulatory protein PhoB [Armatimonadota bacterium]|jgi:two-component system alkaline phosphatase synthesis response regulator PhoP